MSDQKIPGMQHTATSEGCYMGCYAECESIKDSNNVSRSEWCLHFPPPKLRRSLQTLCHCHCGTSPLEILHEIEIEISIQLRLALFTSFQIWTKLRLFLTNEIASRIRLAALTSYTTMFSQNSVMLMPCISNMILQESRKFESCQNIDTL